MKIQQTETTIEFRTAYDGSGDYYSEITGLDCSVEPSLTKQSFREEADINNIVNRLLRGELVNNLNEKPLQYGDVSEITDYHTSLNQVKAAENLFMQIPAEIRVQFNNDPGQFVDFVNDPKNSDALIEMGLATRKGEPPTGGGDGLPNVPAPTPVDGTPGTEPTP